MDERKDSAEDRRGGQEVELQAESAGPLAPERKKQKHRTFDGEYLESVFRTSCGGGIGCGEKA